MKELIEVFRMNELSAETRIELLKKLGSAINNEHATNLTEPVVYELVKILDPENELLKDEHYLGYVKKPSK